MLKVKVHLALFLVALLYAINYVVAKEVMPAYVLPFGFIFMRVIGASILFVLVHAISIREKVKDKKDYFRFAYCAVLG